MFLASLTFLMLAANLWQPLCLREAALSPLLPVCLPILDKTKGPTLPTKSPVSLPTLGHRQEGQPKPLAQSSCLTCFSAVWVKPSGELKIHFPSPGPSIFTHPKWESSLWLPFIIKESKFYSLGVSDGGHFHLQMHRVKLGTMIPPLIPAPKRLKQEGSAKACSLPGRGDATL